MMNVRRTRQPTRGNRGGGEGWLTFAAGDLLASQFGPVLSLLEVWLPPGVVAARQPRAEGELITWVREGALSVRDGAAPAVVLEAGEFQRRSGARSSLRVARNPSASEWVQAFQIVLRPGALDPRRAGPELRRFSAAQRGEGLCLVASPDGRRSSLHLEQPALIYASLLREGQHLVHPLAPGRFAWLHVAGGSVVFGDLVLGDGEGAGGSDERTVSFTAREPSDVLLLDVATGRPPSA